MDDNSQCLRGRELELAPKLVIQGQQWSIWHITHGHLLAKILETLQQSWVCHDLPQPEHLPSDHCVNS
jgi:hypothetical protein